MSRLSSRKHGLAALLMAVACSDPAASSETQSDEAAGAASAVSRWARVIEPSDLSLTEAPAHILTPPGTSGVVAVTFRVQVVQVHVRAGDRVEAGDPIIDVVAPDIVAAAASYRAALRRVRAFEARVTQLEALMQDGIVERSRVFEVAAQLADAQSDRDQSWGTLQAAGLSANTLRARLRGNRLTLVSPVTGIVRSVPATVGEVFEGGATSLASVVGVGRARVEARFSSPPASDLRFEFIAPSGEHHALQRGQEARAVLADDGTTLEWFDFEDETLSLPGGIEGRVRALSGGDVLQVPAGALRRSGDGALVLVCADNTRREVLVRVLASTGASALVSSDSLQVGDEVVADIASVLAAEAEGD